MKAIFDRIKRCGKVVLKCAAPFITLMIISIIAYFATSAIWNMLFEVSFNEALNSKKHFISIADVVWIIVVAFVVVPISDYINKVIKRLTRKKS